MSKKKIQVDAITLSRYRDSVTGIGFAFQLSNRQIEVFGDIRDGISGLQSTYKGWTSSARSLEDKGFVERTPNVSPGYPSYRITPMGDLVWQLLEFADLHQMRTEKHTIPRRIDRKATPKKS